MIPARPRILVVLGHPRSDSLCGGLAEAYAAGARAAGAEVTVLRLGETDFDLASREPSLLRWHGPDQDPAREPEVEQMIDGVREADHLVFVFPQWWGTYPAVLKGYVDRVFLSRFAFAYRESSALWDKRLTGRTARVIMTMDSPAWWDTVKYRRAAVTSLTQAVLWYCGVKTVGVTRLPRVRFSSAEKRAAWLARVEEMGRRDARRRPRPRAGTELSTASRTTP
ncbi:NAD(P)H-dependent oxidoreductase [Actinotalea sp. BY-33]|uniref:NAD(P)H-dependent oxidoreductase n=1 Tax=Actinotalea soli TaxID=2819234 RepID=A0A939RVQ0_9CELL|nr:NAD(P)H-dependent oxidoreductase [Actinotalea soli]MBO1752620.1 NAD(P)H-dependent oxidoreductase [Actinotalea soli]